MAGSGNVKNGYRSEEDMFRFMIENSGDILWTIDLTGQWQFITSNVEKALHIPAKDIVGKTVWDFVAPEYVDKLKNKLKRRMAGEDIPAYEVEVLDKYGRRVPFEVKTSPILDKNGKIIGVQGISRDVTDKKKAEEALRKAYAELERRVEERTRDLASAKATLQGILDTAPIGVIVANAPDGKITFFSRGAEKMFSRPITGCVFDVKLNLVIFHPDGSPYHDNELPLAQALRYGKHVTGAEMLIVWPDGRKRILMASSAPIKDEKGNTTAAVSAIVDITTLKSTEEQLREAKAQAELYLDLMSHDIGNSNTMTMGYLEMAQPRVREDKDTALLLEKAVEMLKGSSRLIENVRVLQKAEQGELQTEIVDLCDVIENSKKRYSSETGRNVTIDITYPVDHGCMVAANRLIEDVFANLIGNAIKHAASDRPVKIDIVMTEVCEAGKTYYMVAVEDNGPGIPDELKSKLFNRLKQGEKKVTGRGLGLYLTKTLVEDSGGKIWVEDRVPGHYHEGSRFIVLLPAAEASPVSEAGVSAG